VIDMELKYALRQLIQRPLFTLVAVVSLAIAIGANAAVFSLVNGLLLKPLPGVATPERMVEIGRTVRGDGFDSLTAGDWRMLSRESKTLDQVFAMSIEPLNLHAGGEPVRALGLLVSENYFTAFGVRAAHGRLFEGPESAPGASPVVVASHAAWQRYFGGEPAAIGRSVQLNGAKFTLVGVADPRFRGHVAVLEPDFFVPLPMAGALRPNGPALLADYPAHWLHLGGRLAAGASLVDARAELEALGHRVAEQRPELESGRGYGVQPLRSLPFFGVRAATLFGALLFTLVGIVLAVACANVAGMLLVRGELRAQEIALRFVLGASRRRVVAQLLLEAGLIATLAGALGLLIAEWARRLVGLLPIAAPYPIVTDFPLDGRVVAFALGATLLTALAFGLWPALRVSQRDPKSAMASGVAGSTPAKTRLREALVAGQIALTLVLLIVAALFGRALSRAHGIDPGFRTEGVAVAQLDLDPAGYDDARALALGERLVARLSAHPGVDAVSTARVVPLTLSRMSYGSAFSDALPEGGIDPTVNVVSEGFFATIGLALKGRDFTADEPREGERAAIVNETFAKQAFGTTDAIGRTFRYGDAAEGGEIFTMRVVGMVPDGRYASLSEAAEPFLFLAQRQWADHDFHLFVRGRLPQAEVARLLDAELRALDPNLPRPQVHRFEDMTALGLLPQRVAGAVAASLGAVGLLLAAIGLYGVIAFQVGRRTREIGIRLALGAAARRIVRDVLRRAVGVAGVGVAVGLVVAAALSVALGALLFGAPPVDVPAFAVGTLVLLVGCGVAAWFPARCAAAIQPSEALRYE
jgi:predicted permease